MITGGRTCIWCKSEHTDRSVEHIVPESLGCPRELVLRNGEVCDVCNSRLCLSE